MAVSFPAWTFRMFFVGLSLPVFSRSWCVTRRACSAMSKPSLCWRRRFGRQNETDSVQSSSDGESALKITHRVKITTRYVSNSLQQQQQRRQQGGWRRRLRWYVASEPRPIWITIHWGLLFCQKYFLSSSSLNSQFEVKQKKRVICTAFLIINSCLKCSIGGTCRRWITQFYLRTKLSNPVSLMWWRSLQMRRR